MSSGCSLLAHSGVCAAEPVVNVTAVGEQMRGFAQFVRRSHRGFEERTGLIELADDQGFATEGHVGADVLPKRAAFAAFPRLKLAAGDELASIMMLARLVVERANFDGEVVALADEVETFGQFAEAFFWL